MKLIGHMMTITFYVSDNLQVVFFQGALCFFLPPGGN